MTLIPACTFLGLSLYGCLVLGNADQVAKGGETQLEHRIQDRELVTPLENTHNGTLVRPTLPPKLLLKNINKRENYTFPIVNKNGDQYYDLAVVKQTQLEISANSQSVKGITASSGECQVRALLLRVAYLLDKDLLAHCHPLNLTLEGKDWKCLQMGRLFQPRVVEVDMTSVRCGDAWTSYKTDVAQRYSMKEGIRKFQEFAISSDLAEICRCAWYFGKDSYTVNVDCEDLGLTDAMLTTLPPLPHHVTRISFHNNSLSSMDRLIEYIQSSNQELIYLNLDNNKMQSLPRIQGSFPKLIDISLINNTLEKIDLEIYEDLVSREGGSLSIEGNPFRCNCNIYLLKERIHQRCKGGWKLCRHNFEKITCKNVDDQEPVPICLFTGEGCVTKRDWWFALNVTLGVLNSFMIYLIVDLIIVLTSMGGKEERRPKIDYVVCILKYVLCAFCRGKHSGAGQVE